MRPARDDGDWPGGAAQADPLSDIFFGFLAVVLVVTCLLAAVAPELPRRTEAAVPELLHRGRATETVLAHRGGLVFAPEGAGRLAVALDAILDGGAVPERLRGYAGGGGPVPLLVIAADGHEAAFLFEAVAAQEGVAEIAFVRLPRTCAAASGVLAALCRRSEGWR